MAHKFVKETTLQVTSHVDVHMLIIESHKTPLPTMNLLSRQKLNRDILNLADVINQKDLMDMYRTFPLNAKQFTFSAPHGTFPKTDHMLRHKENLKRYNKLKLIHDSCKIAMN